MRRLFILIGATLGGWLGWWLGSRLNLFMAFLLSTIGAGVGVYMAQRAFD